MPPDALVGFAKEGRLTAPLASAVERVEGLAEEKAEEVGGAAAAEGGRPLCLVEATTSGLAQAEKGFAAGTAAGGAEVEVDMGEVATSPLLDGGEEALFTGGEKGAGVTEVGGG